MDGINRVSKMTSETSAKKKRQTAWSVIARRRKRNRSFSYYDNEDDDSDESDSEGDDEFNKEQYNHNRDRLENTNDQPYPIWETYDTLNQYYLEIG